MPLLLPTTFVGVGLPDKQYCQVKFYTTSVIIHMFPSLTLRGWNE